MVFKKVMNLVKDWLNGEPGEFDYELANGEEMDGQLVYNEDEKGYDFYPREEPKKKSLNEQFEERRDKLVDEHRKRAQSMIKETEREVDRIMREERNRQLEVAENEHKRMLEDLEAEDAPISEETHREFFGEMEQPEPEPEDLALEETSYFSEPEDLAFEETSYFSDEPDAKIEKVLDYRSWKRENGGENPPGWDDGGMSEALYESYLSDLASRNEKSEEILRNITENELVGQRLYSQPIVVGLNEVEIDIDEKVVYSDNLRVIVDSVTDHNDKEVKGAFRGREGNVLAFLVKGAGALNVKARVEYNDLSVDIVIGLNKMQ